MSINAALNADDLESVVANDAPARRRGWLRGFRSPKIIIGIAITVFFVLVAVVGPFVAPFDPSAVSYDALQPPSLHHLFGTTQTGQDVFSQMLFGARISMLVGVATAVVATFLSVLVGLTAGYVGGFTDEALSLLANVFLVIPGLPLMVILAAYLPKSGSLGIILVISITSWAWGARVLRAQTLSLRKRDFVEAARANGESTWRIITAEILPNLTAIIAAGFVGTVGFAVLSQITLSFVGITPTNEWNWGTVLYWAQAQLALQRGAWWWFVPAGLLIALLGTALALVNFGIDEFVNPRLRSVGLNARTMRQRKIRPRIGFTPVVYEAKEDRA